MENKMIELFAAAKAKANKPPRKVSGIETAVVVLLLLAFLASVVAMFGQIQLPS